MICSPLEDFLLFLLFQFFKSLCFVVEEIKGSRVSGDSWFYSRPLFHVFSPAFGINHTHLLSESRCVFHTQLRVRLSSWGAQKIAAMALISCISYVYIYVCVCVCVCQLLTDPSLCVCVCVSSLLQIPHCPHKKVSHGHSIRHLVTPTPHPCALRWVNVFLCVCEKKIVTALLMLI